MIDIEALAAPAFLVEVAGDAPAGLRLNAAGRARPDLVRCLSDPSPGGNAAGLPAALRSCAAGSPSAEAVLGPSAQGEGGCWRASLAAMPGRDGRAAAVLGICRRGRRPERDGGLADDHLSLALRAIHGAEWRYDVRAGRYHGSDEIATLLGEATPRPVAWAEWLERVYPQDLAGFLERPAPEGTAEFRFHATGGELRWARCSRVAVTDGGGALEAVLGIMVDITQERVRETAWAELATHDPLTGLLNRRGLRQEIDRLRAEMRPAPGLALFAIDLDRFKETNDAHGHAAGDAVLVEASRRLAAALAGAVCARLGGDEFVAVLPVAGDAEAGDLRVRLEGAFRRPLAFRGCWLPVSASVGVARASGSRDVARLMEDADADLYARKRVRASEAA